MGKNLQVLDDKKKLRPMIQEGNWNTQFGYADSVNVYQTMIFANSRDEKEISASTVNFESDFFNLFVVDGMQFRKLSSGSFIMPKDDSLTECVSCDLSEDALRLTDDGIQFLLTLPCLFATKNKRNTLEWKNQDAVLGMLTSIDVLDAGIQISYQTAYTSISQILLNESREKLCVEGRPRHNEFDNPHWTVKRVRLLQTLQELGFVNVFMA